jgi:hypothetical protein
MMKESSCVRLDLETVPRVGEHYEGGITRDDRKLNKKSPLLNQANGCEAPDE